MDQNTDILHEAKRLRLLAAALELQHYTCTAANVVPIPGGDRVIAIGTPADAVRLLDADAQPVGEFAGYVDGEPLVTWFDRRRMPQVGDTLYARSGLSAMADSLPTNLGAGQIDSEGGHHD